MSRPSLLPGALVALVGVIGIAIVQPSLAEKTHKIRQRDDVFLLPPPAQLRAMTLGYRAAGADLVWAKLILEYGLHWQEKRSFPDVTRYIDGIIALEPEFPPLYEFVDTILVYPPPPCGTEEDARTARRYLERGTQERPYDPTVWLRYGQFLAFLAPSFLKDEQEIQRWRVEGAKAIVHAVELGSDAQRSLAAASILDRAGERSATISHLERSYAMTDDPDMREQILLRLVKLKGTTEAEQSIGVVDREWRGTYRFLSRGQLLLIGPRRSPTACAGPVSYGIRGCARDWDAAIADAK
ncbi:hypothetical protein BH11MYX4_BH11MYX4_51010 [soil metagenome]